ncbi:MAG: hypothetical protein FVQ77_05850 [Cytophagales bacterium]|nr:hypothetical protein [Cytophagales bacterium]
MHIQVIQIGNSKGIRLNKTVLERYNIKDKLELILKKGFLVLKPLKKPRAGWGDAFKEMHKNGDDGLLIDDVFIDQIRTIDKVRIYRKVATLSGNEVKKIKNIIKETFVD